MEKTILLISIAAWQSVEISAYRHLVVNVELRFQHQSWRAY